MSNERGLCPRSFHFLARIECSPSDVRDALKHLYRRPRYSNAEFGDSSPHSLSEGLEFGWVDRLHRALELRCMGEKRLDLDFDGGTDVFGVVRGVRLPQQ